MNCQLHNVEMQEKNGEYGVYYSHIIPDVGYCNGKKIKPFKKPTNGTPEVRPASSLLDTPTNNQPTEKKSFDPSLSRAQTALNAAAVVIGSMVEAGILKGPVLGDGNDGDGSRVSNSIAAWTMDVATKFNEQLKELSK